MTKKTNIKIKVSVEKKKLKFLNKYKTKNIPSESSIHYLQCVHASPMFKSYSFCERSSEDNINNVFYINNIVSYSFKGINIKIKIILFLQINKHGNTNNIYLFVLLQWSGTPDFRICKYNCSQCNRQNSMIYLIYIHK